MGGRLRPLQLRPRVRCVSPTALCAASTRHAPPALPSIYALALAGDPAGGWWPTRERAHPEASTWHAARPLRSGDGATRGCRRPSPRLTPWRGSAGGKERGGEEAAVASRVPRGWGPGIPCTAHPQGDPCVWGEAPHTDLVRGFHSLPPKGQGDTASVTSLRKLSAKEGQGTGPGPAAGPLWCPVRP